MIALAHFPRDIRGSCRIDDMPWLSTYGRELQLEGRLLLPSLLVRLQSCTYLAVDV